MDVKAALGLSQVFSMIVFVTIARWYVMPWLKIQERATALVALLWPHVFRYVALQAYSAQHAGFPISDSGVNQIVYGDVAGMILALIAITALRHAARLAIALVWLLVIATAVDTVLNVSGGIREHLFGAATGVTWMVVGFVSLGLTVWQLYSRRGEPLRRSIAAAPRMANHLSMAR
ncbi:MAG TPA: hypothetical protein VGY99_30070 [Candidatus Binataceae bacterium]|jgi:hypothetical protein|nr:hypothetical protein [Candidatus Binataceae bacterium]